MSAKSKRRHAGFTLVELTVVIAIIAILVGLTLPAVQAIREAANRTSCANNLKQIGLATILYADAHDHTLPPAYARDKGASWMLLIVPYLEQDPLNDRWDLKKTYYEQPDVARLTPLKLYFCPTRRASTDGCQSVIGDTPSIGQNGIVSVPGPGPNVPGALADYAGSLGLSDL